MRKFINLCFATLIIVSCEQKNQQETTPITDNTAIDTVAIINDPKNNLNVQTNSFFEIDSSGIIMFPLSMGEINRDGGSLSYKEIPYRSYWNIIFYNSHNSEYHLLSDRKILVNSFDVSYSDNNNENIAFTKNNIFYRIIVDDYNKDKKLTSEDPGYLFTSDKEGNNFRQISPTGYNLKSWQFIKSTNKIIMTVTKDTDNNKKFGDKDEVASFQIDIDKQNNPIEIFSADFKKKLKLTFDKDWKKIKE